MRIIVCVARVIDPEAPIEVERGRASFDESALRHSLNPADVNAVEFALQLRDSSAGEIVALTLGTTDCEETLRTVLAQGVDQALLLSDPAFFACDCMSTARVLASAVRALAPDVVVCGARSLDGDSGQVGPQIAELLGMPCVDNTVTARVVDSRELVTERRAGGGFRVEERTALPVLLTVEAGVNVPRYPTLRARLRSKSAPIDRWDVQKVPLSEEEISRPSTLEIRGLSRPPPDPRGMVIPASDLPAEQRWMIAASGGLQEREGGLLEGPAEELADKLTRLLEQGGYLSGG
jgi:electron transfer flavoprotein beta subunit